MEWTCPNCNKHHSKEHYPFPDQIDKKKGLGEFGRVKKGWEEKNYSDKGQCKPEDAKLRCDNPKMETGPAIDKEGLPSSLLCPHCGYLQEMIIINKIVKKKK